MNDATLKGCLGPGKALTNMILNLRRLEWELYHLPFRRAQVQPSQWQPSRYDLPTRSPRLGLADTALAGESGR